MTKTNYLDKYNYLLNYMEQNYGTLNEAAPQGGAPGGMPDDGGMMPPGGAPDQMGGEPGGMPGDMGGAPDQMGGAPGGMPGDMDGAPAAPPQGFSPQTGDEADGGMQPGDDIPGDMGGAPDQMGGDMSMDDGEDVEEIDVDDLVDSQEATEHKVNKILKKFSSTADKMMSSLEDMNSKIEGTMSRMDNPEKEIAKRNPTPIEKLSLRSGKAYPFSTTPEKYWEKAEATTNYSTEEDNDDVDPQYTITKADVDAIQDYDSISKDMSKRALNIRDFLDF